MKVRLNSLSDGKQVIDAALDGDEIDLAGLDLCAPVAVTLTIDKGASEIKIDGQLETTARFECDRCLANFSFPIKGTFGLIASYSTADSEINDDDIVPLTATTNEIDLTGYVHDMLLLGVPMKLVCREDCRGLCPSCGVNLNETECRCAETAPDPRWEPLKKIVNNITEDK